MGDQQLYNLINGVLQQQKMAQNDERESTRTYVWKDGVVSEGIDYQIQASGGSQENVKVIFAAPVDEGMIVDQGTPSGEASVGDSQTEASKPEEKKNKKNLTVQVDNSLVIVKHDVKKRKKGEDLVAKLVMTFSNETHTHTYTIEQKGQLVNTNEDQVAKSMPNKREVVVTLGPTTVSFVPTLEQLKCVFCGQIFDVAHQLNSHKRFHCKNKPYKCEVCEMTFTQMDTLRRHKNMHSGVKPFKCDKCDMSFLYRTTLAIHKQTHDGAKRFSCDVCGKQFARSSNLNQHYRLHTGERPYECHFCDKKFIASTDLKRHIKSNHSPTAKTTSTKNTKKVLKCSFCNAGGFQTTDHVIEHMRINHCKDDMAAEQLKLQMATGDDVYLVNTE